MTKKKINVGTICLNIVSSFNKNVRDFYVVNPVGDANCIFISNSAEQKSAMLDFGGNKLDSFCKEQLAFSNIFILSHYHKDHYEGLLQLKKEAGQTHYNRFYIENGAKKRNGLRKHSFCAAARAANVYSYKHKTRVAC